MGLQREPLGSGPRSALPRGPLFPPPRPAGPAAPRPNSCGPWGSPAPHTITAGPGPGPGERGSRPTKAPRRIRRPHREAGRVEILGQGDEVLAREPGDLLVLLGGDGPVGLQMRDDPVSETVHRVPVEEEVRGDPHQTPVAHEMLHRVPEIPSWECGPQLQRHRPYLP